MKKQTLLHFTRRCAALAGAAVLMAVTAFSGTADAANSYGAAVTTASGAETFQFDKYLVMDKGISVPGATFHFKLTAGTATNANTVNGATMDVMAGVGADKVKWNGEGAASDTGSVSFATSDTAYTDVNAKVKDYDNTTQQYAKKEAKIDFTECGFTEPGVYRYVLTETASAQTGITNDTAATRIVDVYVNDASDDSSNKLQIAGYVLHAEEGDSLVDFGSGDAGPATKSQGFTNTYTAQTLTISNTVEGNQGSKDKYFKYEVELTNADAEGASYIVDVSGAEASLPATGSLNKATLAAYANRRNPESFTDEDSDGTATATFYLQHGQQVVIKGLLTGTTYKVTVTPEDYTAEATGIESNAVSGTVAAANVTTAFTLTRAGVIPTGVIMTVAPFAAVTLLGAAGIVGVTRRKKHEDEEI